jgi:hypothetical protein
MHTRVFDGGGLLQHLSQPLRGCIPCISQGCIEGIFPFLSGRANRWANKPKDLNPQFSGAMLLRLMIPNPSLITAQTPMSL